jgi:hypothetical protein
LLRGIHRETDAADAHCGALAASFVILRSKVSPSKYQKHVEYRLTVDTMFFVPYSLNILLIAAMNPRL